MNYGIVLSLMRNPRNFPLLICVSQHEGKESFLQKLYKPFYCGLETDWDNVQ